MEAMSIYTAAQPAIIPAHELGQQLFNRFIAFIDRTERTAKTYTTNLRQFMAWLRYAAVTRPVRDDVITYREWLLAEHDAIELDPAALTGWKYRTDKAGNRQTVTCRPNTVKQYIQSVKQFFSWTAAEGLYPNIAANVHTPKITEAHRKDSLTAAEVLTVETSIAATAADRQAAAATMAKDTAGRVQRSTEQGKRLYAMYLLAVNAGLRTIEISRANVKDIEIKGGQAWLYVWGKGHSEADAKKPLAREVYAAIKEYISSRTDNVTGNSPLFVSTGNRSHGKRIASTTISTMLKGALQQAGYDSDRLTAHSLRHTAGQNVLAITGDNIYKTQMYMRHSSPKTTEIYLDNDSSAQDASIAAQLYSHYHGGAAADTAADKVQAAMQNMTPAQLEQLAAIAAAMQAK